MEAAAAHLRSTDFRTAEAAPDELFDIWYASAKSYASGTATVEDVHLATTSLVSTLCTTPIQSFYGGMDDSQAVISNMLSVLNKVISIFTVKPKFTAVVTNDRRLLAAVIEAVSKFLLGLILGANPHLTKFESVRCEAVALLCAVVSLERTVLDAVPSSSVPTAQCERLPWELLSSVMTDLSVDYMLRERLVDLLALACQISLPTRRGIVGSIVLRGKDAVAMDVLWRAHCLSDPPSLEALRSRFRREREACTVRETVYQPASGGSVGVETPLTSRRTEFDFVAPSPLGRVVLSSLHEFLLNRRSQGTATLLGGARGSSSNESSPAVTVAAEVSGLTLLLSDLDDFQPRVPAPAQAAVTSHNTGVTYASLPNLRAAPVSESGELLERSDEWLSIWRSAVEECPSSRQLLQLLLAFPTVNSLATLNGILDSIDVRGWVEVVLPAIRTHLSSMKPFVTGCQEDQEVINVLRDGMRHWYFGGAQGAQAASPELGHAFVAAAAIAMCRGYSDTDRFPEIIGRVVRHHASNGSHAWIGDVVNDTVCGTPGGMRGASDVLLVCLGLDTSSAGYGVEERAVDETRPEDSFVSELLAALAGLPGLAVLSIWRDLCHEQPKLVKTQDSAVCTLLNAIAARLTVIRGSPWTDLDAELLSLRSITRTLCALSSCATPATSGHVFELLTQTIEIREGRACYVGLLTASQVQQFNEDNALSGEAIAEVASYIPLSPALSRAVDVPTAALLPLSLGALQSAILHANSACEYSLARILPTRFLLHGDIRIRTAALTELTSRFYAAAVGVDARQATASTATAIHVLRSCPPDVSDADSGLLHTIHSNPTLMLRQLQFPSMVCLEHVLPAGTVTPHALPTSGSIFCQLAEGAVHESGLVVAAIPACCCAVIRAIGDLVETREMPTAEQEYLALYLFTALVARLIRAAAVTSESNPQGVPDAGVLQWLNWVAIAAPPLLLRKYALSGPGLRRLDFLANLSPNWARVASTLERGNVIMPVSAVVSSPYMHTDAPHTPATLGMASRSSVPSVSAEKRGTLAMLPSSSSVNSSSAYSTSAILPSPEARETTRASAPPMDALSSHTSTGMTTVAASAAASRSPSVSLLRTVMDRAASALESAGVSTGTQGSRGASYSGGYTRVHGEDDEPTALSEVDIELTAIQEQSRKQFAPPVCATTPLLPLSSGVGATGTGATTNPLIDASSSTLETAMVVEQQAAPLMQGIQLPPWTMTLGRAVAFHDSPHGVARATSSSVGGAAPVRRSQRPTSTGARQSVPLPAAESTVEVVGEAEQGTSEITRLLEQLPVVPTAATSVPVGTRAAAHEMRTPAANY